MEITGVIIATLPPKSGTSASGKDWKLQEYVIEETGQRYPKRVCFDVLGDDKIKQLDIHQGVEYKISFDIDAREWNGRWFNSVHAWKAEKIQNAQSVAPNQERQVFKDPFPQAQTTVPPQNQTQNQPPEEDDLPF